MDTERNWIGFAFLAAVLLVLASPHIDAQVAGGTILGSIVDTSGVAIPGAEVTIRNSQTGVSRTVEANAEGFYRAPNLLPGNYEITVAAPNFKTVVRSGLILTVGAELAVNIGMSVGSVAERVEVRAEAPTVNTSNATLSGIVNGTEVRDLPLNGRDWTSLATLQPGVATIRTQPGLFSAERMNRGLANSATISGNRAQQNNYRLDGISINDHANQAPGDTLTAVIGVDAIQEFSVVTTNAGASYGRTSGGVVNAITRTGTNQLHGAGYEFLRNSALDARNFFDPPHVPPFRRNQFGAELGGPIVRDRTFIFGDYEGLRQSLSVTQLVVVPSLAARSGNIHDSQGNPVSVTVDPNIRRFLGYYPLPSSPPSGDFGTFTSVTAQNSREDFFTTRVDHKFSDRDSLFTTYLYDNAKSTSPEPFDAVLIGFLSGRQTVVVEETHTFSPRFLNSLRFGFNRPVGEGPKALQAINPLASDPSLSFVPGLVGAGSVSVPGLTTFNGGVSAQGEYDFHYNSFQVYDDAFFTKGSHALKFGGLVERIQNNQIGHSGPAGNFAFGSLAGFLTNQPTLFSAPVGGAAGVTPRGLRQTIVGGYFEDEWKARRNLTLTLGLRYEMATVLTEVQGKLSNLRTLTATQPTVGSPYFSNPTKRNFEPRVGFAWDPFGSGKTSVSGGFGVYDNLPLPYIFFLANVNATPFYKYGSVVNPPAGSLPGGGFGLISPTSFTNWLVQPNPPRSYVMQWNFHIERQLAQNLTLNVGYVGSRGLHMPYTDFDINYVMPTATSTGYVWPTPVGSGTKVNPGLGTIEPIVWNSDSIFHSLQVQVNKRLSHGLQLGGSYTWGKSVDTGTSTSGTDYLNSTRRLWFDPKSGRGRSDFDIRHNFVLDYIWLIPGPRTSSALARVARGWEWGGIYHLQTGMPFTPNISGGDVLGMKNSSPFDYPDVVPGCGPLVNPGNVSHYINTQCFAFPNPSTRLGNVGRNILIGPGLSNFDMSLFKNNRVPKISETFNAQFRVEFFNILNQANFAPPTSNRTVFNAAGAPVGSAGLITSAATPRNIQLGLKVMW